MGGQRTKLRSLCYQRHHGKIVPDLFVQFGLCEVIAKVTIKIAEFESAVSQHCTLKMITVTPHFIVFSSSL